MSDDYTKVPDPTALDNTAQRHQMHTRQEAGTKEATKAIVARFRDTRKMTDQEAEGLAEEQKRLDSIEVKVGKNLSAKKVLIAEELVNQRHPLSKINFAKALPILKYLPAWLVQHEENN